MGEIRQIAIYGKGGIGKSTTTQNLTNNSIINLDNIDKKVSNNQLVCVLENT